MLTQWYVSGETTQREEGGEGEISTGSGPGEGRPTHPLTKGDIKPGDYKAALPGT